MLAGSRTYKHRWTCASSPTGSWETVSGARRGSGGGDGGRDTHVSRALDIAVLDERDDLAYSAFTVVVARKIEARGVEETEQGALAVPQDLDLALGETGLRRCADEAGNTVELCLGCVGRDGCSVEQEAEQGRLANAGRPCCNEGVSGDAVWVGGRGGEAGCKARANVHGWEKGAGHASRWWYQRKECPLIPEMRGSRGGVGTPHADRPRSLGIIPHYPSVSHPRPCRR